MSKIQKIIAIGTALTTIVSMSGLTYFAPIAAAKTTAELEAEIAALMASLDALKAELAKLTGTPAATYEGIPADFEFTKLLKKGSKGDEVKYLQIVLQEEVGEDVVGAADGSFGPKTDKATKQFQGDNDLKADGIVGKNTRAVLNALLVAVPPVAELTVASISPASNATSVAVGSNVTITLSMAVDSATVTADSVKLTAGTTAVAAATTVSDKTITIDPTADLAENTTYTVTLTTAVKATDGTALKAESSSSFSTGETVVPPVTGGLTVKLVGPVSAMIPIGSSAEFLKASLLSDVDAKILSLTVTAGGLGAVTQVDSVVLYVDGVRKGSVKDINSSGYAAFNLSTPIELKAGIASELLIKATIASGTAASTYSLAITEIVSDGVTVSGLPVRGNEMSATTATLGTLTFAAGSTPADVNLGDKDAVIANFKVSNDNIEDIKIERITLKRDTSLATIIKDSDIENLELWYAGAVVATTEKIVDNYITFTLATPVTIQKNQSNKVFTVKADIIGGAGYDIRIKLDSTADVFATGLTKKYPSTIAGSYAGAAIDVNAGVVTIEKVNAPNEKIRSGAQTDVVFGTFNITANSGNEVEITTLKLTIVATDESTASAVVEYTETENWEVYDSTTGLTYDLTYDSSETGNSASYKTYENNDPGLLMQSGETHALIVRADTTSIAANAGYTVSIDSVSGGDLVLRETADETSITDITPNSVSLKKVTIQGAGITFSINALSAAYDAVIGAEDVQIVDFNVKTNATSPVKITELQFDDEGANTIDSTVVSAFKLFAYGSDTPIKVVSASQLSSEEITFSDLSVTIPASTTARYILTVSLVSDTANNGKVLKYDISGYTAEDADPTFGGDSVYDTTNDSDSDGDIVAAQLVSARTVTIRSVGMLYVDIYNTDSNVNTDTYVIGGTTGNYLAAIKVRAANESVKIEDLAVYASYASVGNVFSSLSLYDQDGNLLKQASNVAQTTTFEDINYVVPTSSKVLYLKGSAYAIGKDQAGAVDRGTFASDISWRAQGIVAAGNSSGASLVTGDLDGDGGTAGEIVFDTDGDGAYDEASGDAAYTAVSNKAYAVASRIADVEFVNTNGGYNVASSLTTSGTYNAAIIKVTNSAYSNTLATGDVLKTVLQTVKIKLTYDASTVIGAVTLQRINGAAASALAINASSTPTAGTKYLNFDLTASGFSVDDEIAASDSAYYLIQVPVTLQDVTAQNDWIQIDLDLLDGTAGALDADADATGANFKWQDGTDATAKYPLRIKGKIKVEGVKIIEVAR